MSELNGARQVILVTSRYEGKDNIITLAWHMPTSFHPELYAISVGKTRYSYEMIKNSKVFCVNFLSADMKNIISACGETSGRLVDKFKEFNIDKEECETISCSRIKQALGFLECKVVETLETGDHAIFIGKVLKSKLKERGKRLYHITGDEFTTTVD